MDRQHDPILNSELSHQLGNMCFDSAFFNAQRNCNFPVGLAGDKHRKNLSFPVRKAIREKTVAH